MEQPLGWQEIRFWLKDDYSRPMALELLATPGEIDWGATAETLDWIRDSFDTILKPFFDLSCLAGLLSQGRSSFFPVPQWLDAISRETLPPALSLPEASNGTWRAVPVMVVDQQSASIVHFLVGALPKAEQSQRSLFPCWAKALLTEESRQAVADAFEAAHALADNNRYDLFTFPLTCPQGRLFIKGRHQNDLLIQGRSLGLPLALGAQSALRNSSLPSSWLATGDVDNQGQVSPVGSLPQKYELAKQKTYKLFLFPQKNHDQVGCIATGDMETQQVNTLDLAKLWVEYGISPEARKEMTTLQTARQSPSSFVNNCLDLSVSAIQYCCGDGMGKQLLQAMTNAPDTQLARSFVERIETSLKNRQYDQAEALSHLFDEEDFIQFGEMDAVAALSYCSSRLALVNHQGWQKKGKQWYARGDAYSEQARTSKEGQEIYARFINRYFGVGSRHNNYDFHSDLPQEFMTFLQRQERFNELQDFCSDYALGAFFGTLTQDYAFRGPLYLKQTRKTVAKAMRAFGNGKEPNLRKDWAQQVSYLFFALLDAGEFDEARMQLSQLLPTMQLGADIPIDLTRDHYQLFALARLLADSPEPLSDHLGAARARLLEFACQDAFPSINEQYPHPWQLIWYNLGRLAQQQGETDLAEQAWQRSLDLCVSAKGETMQVMGLLSLAAILVAKGKLTPEQREIARRISGMLHTSPDLNKQHFRQLLEAGTEEEAVRLVGKQPAIFFPFIYR